MLSMLWLTVFNISPRTRSLQSGPLRAEIATIRSQALYTVSGTSLTRVTQPGSMLAANISITVLSKVSSLSSSFGVGFCSLSLVSSGLFVSVAPEDG